ncbi:MAG TPA: hypothetical protein VF618_14045 [Thermoanaerobaculia bacterium]
MNWKPLVLLGLLLSTPALAQELSIGNGSTGAPNSSDAAGAIVRTDVDLVHPASAAGTVTTVRFQYSGACPGGVKIKFFRRFNGSLTMVAERGPFNTANGANTVTMTPAVTVREGDLIGITRMTNCSSPTAYAGFVSEGYLQFGGDVTGTVPMAAGLNPGAVLALGGTGTATEYRKAVIPVAGSAAGGFGSFFRTSVQLFNPHSTAITGKLIFHRAGTEGLPTDPTVSFTLAPRQVTSYPDIVAAAGANGLGSFDLVLPAAGSSREPIIATRVFNDGGAAGTAGFNEQSVALGSTSFINHPVMVAGVTGYLLTPADTTRQRLNVGVRTLSSGAVLTVRLKDSAGTVIRTVTKTYQPNWFEQVSAESFVGGAIGANQQIEISVSSGGVIVYGANTDNTTNDPAITFAYGVFAIA